MTKKKKKSTHKDKHFVFQPHDKIGHADALDDKKFLGQAFVDDGALETLADVSNPICYVVGRTGMGKSALLSQLRLTTERSIVIEPEQLSLSYIENNDVISFFVDAGVKMDLFYRLLWRHLFIVEIIKRHYEIDSAQSQQTLFEKWKEWFSKDRSKSQCLEYLEEWSDKFWLDTEYRVQEITKTLIDGMKNGFNVGGSASLQGNGVTANGNAEFIQSISEVEKSELVRKGQEVINQLQLSQLAHVMSVLNDVLSDNAQKQYHITIDRLDESWVSSKTRYELIRALLDTIAVFNQKIANVKSIVAIRLDLLNRVFRETRDEGYQEEKYRSRYLEIRWDRRKLVELLDKRVAILVKSQYTSEEPTFVKLLPSKINKQDPISYFLSRTLYRPRDAIIFFNQCIVEASNKAKFTQKIISQAELTYSDLRLRAVGDEWAADYPQLVTMALWLKNYKSQFTGRKANVEELFENNLIEILSSDKVQPFDKTLEIAQNKYDKNDVVGFYCEVICILYEASIVGIKLNTAHSVQWCYEKEKLIRVEDIDLDTQIYIHPAFWRVMGTKTHN